MKIKIENGFRHQATFAVGEAEASPSPVNSQPGVTPRTLAIASKWSPRGTFVLPLKILPSESGPIPDANDAALIDNRLWVRISRILLASLRIYSASIAEKSLTEILIPNFLAVWKISLCRPTGIELFSFQPCTVEAFL
jgi:hypothetical protein